MKDRYDGSVITNKRIGHTKSKEEAHTHTAMDNGDRRANHGLTSFPQPIDPLRVSCQVAGQPCLEADRLYTGHGY